jgi:hypothetical protein
MHINVNSMKSLFLERKNYVFTAKGLTNSYEMLIGIDQGDVFVVHILRSLIVPFTKTGIRL